MAAVKQPSELELQVLSVLWQCGPLTVRQVQSALPDGKTRAYTTVLSVIQVMEKKGLLVHKRKGQAYVYKPAVRRQSVLGPMVRNMVRNVFAGKPSAVLQMLLSGKSVGKEELDQIQDLIDQAKLQKRTL